MAAMAGGGGGNFLHYTDMKKFLKDLLLWNPWSEIISQESSFEKLHTKILSVINIAVVNGGFLHYMDMKKFLKNL